MVDAKKLSGADWLNEGVRVLAKSGHGALRVERLATNLGVSRGSFYWHFKDVSAFECALLDQCVEEMVLAPYRRAHDGAEGNAAIVLSNLIRASFRHKASLDKALHVWSASSKLAAQRTEEIGRQRIDLLAQAFEATGRDAASARNRATALYWTYIGHCLAPNATPSRTIAEELIEIFV